MVRVKAPLAIVGGLWAVHLFPPGNDTGRVREVTIRRKLPCEIASGGTPVSGGTPQGSLAKGSWHGGAVTEGFTAGTLSKNKPMWKPVSLLSPRLGVAEAPPFDKGGFGLHIHCHRSNDTGRVREVTITDQPGAKMSAGTARL